MRSKACPNNHIFSFFICSLAASVTNAGEADVVSAKAQCANTTCNFSATLKHDDEGWEHYANHWRILDTQGNELGRRELLHPHVNEQPFTRSLGAVEIPPEITTVIIEAHDSVHEYGGETFTIELAR